MANALGLSKAKYYDLFFLLNSDRIVLKFSAIQIIRLIDVDVNALKNPLVLENAWVEK